MKKVLLCCLACAFIACYSTGPFENGFSITSIEFTGDSTGFPEKRGTPYCEYSLEWESAGSNVEYKLYRSTETGIESDPSQAVLLCTTAEREWVDSYGLEWGTAYHYAVAADDVVWTVEETVNTPGYPFPPPCELTFQKTGFTDCSLEWTQAQGSFQSYAVLGSDFPDIADNLWYADTLFVSTTLDSTQYTHHTASPTGVNYFAVAVSDEEGLSSLSNEVEFTSGGDVPWIVSYSRVIYGLQGRNYGITDDGERLTCSRNYSGYSLGKVLSSDDGLPIYDATIGEGYITILESLEILVSHITSDGYMLSLYSEDFSTEIISRSFPCVQWAVEVDNGILCGCNSTSYLVDRQTLQTVESFSFGFKKSTFSLGGDRLYLLNSSGVLVLDPSELSITGGIPGSFINIQMGADGNLRCISSQRVDVYSTSSLSLLFQFYFPQSAGIPVVTALPPECNLVYVPVWDGDRLIFAVWDIITGETLGTVIPQQDDYVQLWDLLVSPDGDFLWCLGYEADNTQHIFRISIQQ